MQVIVSFHPCHVPRLFSCWFALLCGLGNFSSPPCWMVHACNIYEAKFYQALIQLEDSFEREECRIEMISFCEIMHDMLQNIEHLQNEKTFDPFFLKGTTCVRMQSCKLYVCVHLLFQVWHPTLLVLLYLQIMLVERTKISVNVENMTKKELLLI